MDHEAKQRRLEELRDEVRRLETELAQESQVNHWPPTPTSYVTYQVLAGFVLGVFGAITSLIFNVVGSLIVGQYPLQLIRVYLTFPLGETALALGDAPLKVNDDLILAMGCCLYLGTGMLLGIPFQLMLSRLGGASFAKRFAAVTALALALWIINYYLILAWLQPLLFHGNWIVTMVPLWVAALTHLVFGWTMLIVNPLGVFVPYRRPAEALSL